MPVLRFLFAIVTAISTASSPKSVVNLITGFRETEDVSLKGSPTVSPTTVASCSAVPFCFNSTSNFFGIVSRAPGVRHEDRLIQTEDRDRDQVSNEVEGLDKGKRQRSEEDREEYIEHALLRILRANLHNFLAVRNRSLLHSFQPDIRFDEFDCPVSARRYGQRGSAGKPVNHCSAGDQSQNKWRMQERKIANVFCQTLGQRHDDRKNHRRSTHYGRSNQHRFGGCLECVAGAVIGFE